MRPVEPCVAPQLEPRAASIARETLHTFGQLVGNATAAQAGGDIHPAEFPRLVTKALGPHHAHNLGTIFGHPKGAIMTGEIGCERPQFRVLAIQIHHAAGIFRPAIADQLHNPGGVLVATGPQHGQTRLRVNAVIRSIARARLVSSVA